MALAKKKSKTKPNSKRARRAPKHNGFAICVDATCLDLVVGETYRVMDDPDALAEGWVRVVDESGEDYLFPTSCFVPIQIEKSDERRLSAALRDIRPPKTG